MAGLYPDIPGSRFALDQDGSVMSWRNYSIASAWTNVTGSIAQSQKPTVADYIQLGASTVHYSIYMQIAVGFPEPRTVNGLYLHTGYDNGGIGTGNFTWEYSTDTTDGTDGTWTSVAVTFAYMAQHSSSAGTSYPYYRSDIGLVSLNNVTGIRVRWSGTGGYDYLSRLYVLHIYGQRPSSGINSLCFWDPSADQAVDHAYLDFGDAAQGEILTRQLRVKNLSGSLTANNITLSVNDLLGQFNPGLELSTDGTSYTPSINIGNLASGSVSGNFYIRRTVPAAASTTQRSASLIANAASWA